MYCKFLNFRNLLAVTAVVFAVSACSTDQVSSPKKLNTGFISSANGLSFAYSTPSGKTLTFYSNKYHWKDKGWKHGRGTYFQCRAFIRGADQKALIEITTGDFDGNYFTDWSGNFEHAHIKISKDFKKQTSYYTKNWGPEHFKWKKEEMKGYQAVEVTGLSHGVELEIKAHIKDYNGKNDAEDWCYTQAGYAPDLNTSIIATGYAQVNTVVHIDAAVENLSQDFGTEADCYLFVNNVKVDSIKGMFVDATDASRCRFVYTFTAEGPQVVTVQALPTGLDRDFNLSNNSSSKTIEVADLRGGSGGSGGGSGGSGGGSGGSGGGSTGPRNFPIIIDAAFIRQQEYTDYLVQTTTLGVGTASYSEQVDSTIKNFRIQNSLMTLTGFGLLQFPLISAQVSQTTNGALIHSASYGVLFETAPKCFYDVADGYEINICVRDTTSQVTYNHMSQSVSYLSAGFIKTYLSGGLPTNIYVVPGSSSNSGSWTPFGSEITFNFNVRSAGGNMVFTKSVPMNVAGRPRGPFEDCSMIGLVTSCFISGRSFERIVYSDVEF